MGGRGEVERAAAGGGKNGDATGAADGDGEVERLTWYEFATAFDVFRYVHCKILCNRQYGKSVRK
jgi:hypothetical protein